ncbi:hypothetical protein BpHYR1_053734 [Brachionus plicatilis]|uniref:Uncharacterized protein n=1 Tax=Brachionus plicatilis TaxID=10195 RepID=A0A3M7PSG8_BRAPC|nr:hypothetical protein BpHYR1_053734 [Brachionus plicatilis]
MFQKDSQYSKFFLNFFASKKATDTTDWFLQKGTELRRILRKSIPIPFHPFHPLECLEKWNGWNGTFQFFKNLWKNQKT